MKIEIKELPRPAIVAFASRCARRIAPLFPLSWPYAPTRYKHAVIMAIDSAEQYTFDAKAANLANTAAHAAKTTYIAASAAASAAYNAAKTNDDLALDAMAEHAYATVAYAYTFIKGTTIQTDFERLRQTARKENWTNNTPIPQAFFGPLWPEGEPDWQAILDHHDGL